MPQPPWDPLPVEGERMGRITVVFRFWAAEGVPFLAEPEVVRVFLRFLDRWTRETMCHARIYCFLPERLEVLLGGHEEMSRPWRAIEGFRDSADNWLARKHPEWKLAPGNDDRFVDPEDRLILARTILASPLDAGLVKDPYEYPYTGSMGFDLWRAVEATGDR